MARIAEAAKRDVAENRLRRKLREAVPSNWCDPLLTGPHAVIGVPPYDCRDIERLLNALRERITTTVSEAQKP